VFIGAPARCVGISLAALLAGAGPGMALADDDDDAPDPSQITRIVQPNITTRSLPGYRTTEHSSIYADAAHVRGFGLDGEDRVISKVGIEFKLAQSDWKIGYGGLGFRLAGDARMTFRLRRSGFGIFMRSTF